MASIRRSNNFERNHARHFNANESENRLATLFRGHRQLCKDKWDTDACARLAGIGVAPLKPSYTL